MKKLLILLVVAGVAAVSCDKEGKIPAGPEYKVPEFSLPEEGVELKRREDIELTKAQKALVNGTVDFSFNMLKQTVGKGNVALSPLSAAIALSMLSNGAAGETRQEIVNALGFTDAGISAVNEYNRMLLTKLPDLDNTGIMSFANSLWMNSGFNATGFAAYESFQSALVDNYDAVVYAYDFADGPAIINKWCSDMTNGLIPEVLKELNPDCAMILANALYFKGIWANKFLEKYTAKEFFRNAEGTAVQVDMMNVKRYISYMSNDQFALAELTFGNRAFRFQVLLPTEGVTADECLAGLTGGQWLEAQSALKSNPVELKLPKFKIQMNESVDEILEALGIEQMYSEEKADFSNISDTCVWVDNVQQATSFSIDEDGSEAAAVTIIEMVGESTGEDKKEPEYIPFHVDRPFIFLIREVSTNVILFIGKVDKL